MTAPALTIAEILGHESALTDLPTFGRMTGQAESTIYQLAAQGRLPMEVIRLGRKRYVRTVDVWNFLGLVPQETGTAFGVQPEAPAGNDEATRGPAGSPLSSKSATTSK
ncbi:helix-turn-helix domain-containing protein [Streptomyces cylindrosporus]|uniref:Helix-turn-helix domain-containing protein n=1 Tax=Streptomyces cylindrosporus TaxID=2927583 RepID=A0ABS9Y4H0_9ACTN|nr:helix-turn-helix domain-containing protein [Streptomyces cylindrosporus]MCI3272119.1 helix-turn-helix domain-containing protein [Streptomyces cylindrosporus]